MELTNVQMLFYLWRAYNSIERTPCKCYLEFTDKVHIYFFDESVDFIMPKSIYDSFDWAEEEFEFWDIMTPFDATAPYRAAIIEVCKQFEHGLLTINEFTSIVDRYNELADITFSNYYILDNARRLK